MNNSQAPGVFYFAWRAESNFLAEMIEKGVKKNIITDSKIFGRDPGIPVQKYTGNNTKWPIAPMSSIFC